MNFARLVSKFSKSAKMTPKKFYLKKIKKRYKKTENFMLILNPLKKLLKNAPKSKSYKQNKFDGHE